MKKIFLISLIAFLSISLNADNTKKPNISWIKKSMKKSKELDERQRIAKEKTKAMKKETEALEEKRKALISLNNKLEKLSTTLKTD